MSTKNKNTVIEPQITVKKNNVVKVEKIKEDNIKDLPKELRQQNKEGKFNNSYPKCIQVLIDVLNEIVRDNNLGFKEVHEILVTTSNNKNTFRELVEKNVISKNGQGRYVLQNGNNLITLDIVFIQRLKEDKDDKIDNKNKNFYSKLLKDLILKLSVLNMMHKDLIPYSVDQKKFNNSWKVYYSNGHRLGKLFEQLKNSNNKTKLNVAYPKLTWSSGSTGLVDKYFTPERKEIINNTLHDVDRWIKNDSKKSKPKVKQNWFDSNGNPLTPSGFNATKQMQTWEENQKYIMVENSQNTKDLINDGLIPIEEVYTLHAQKK